MDQAHEKSGDIGDIRKIHKLQSDLHSTTLRLQAVQRNYDALSRVIRDKQQQAIKVRTVIPLQHQCHIDRTR